MFCNISYKKLLINHYKTLKFRINKMKLLVLIFTYKNIFKIINKMIIN